MWVFRETLKPERASMGCIGRVGARSKPLGLPPRTPQVWFFSMAGVQPMHVLGVDEVSSPVPDVGGVLRGTVVPSVP